MLRQEFAFDSTTTQIVAPVVASGNFVYYILHTPAFSNSPTAALTIQDSSGYTLYTLVSGVSKSSDSTNVSTYTIYVDGSSMNFVLTLSGPAGGTGGKVVLYIPSITVQGFINNASYEAFFAQRSQP